MAKTVGIIGLWIMGGAIAANLMERGWTVLGYDVVPERMEALKGTHFEPMQDVAAVARAAPIILTSLPKPAAALEVAGQIAAGGAPSRIVAEVSTFALADKLAFKAILERVGHVPLDCPLSGTGAQAKARDLVVYASGEPGAVDECGPLFDDFSRARVDLGVFGNGSKMKFIANLLVAIHNVAAAEAMVLGVRAGLDPKQVVDVIGGGAGTSRMFQMRAPMMASRAYEPPTMRNAMWQKDMDIIAEFARSLGSPTPLFDETAPIYAKTLAMGLGNQDTAAVYEVLAQGEV